MEIELEPRVGPLSYKIKAMSRESSSQKASNVLDADLRSHWSTGTNTKEWVLLELDEPCLLSHIRIHNKSVLEWEIAAGLRYKPETFVKVRSRCEAPRRDIIYSTNYTPCRYVRFSCLRGNPIAIFFIQLIGVHVSGLEPEFQSIVNFLLPHILSHKQDAHDIHLELLQDITSRLLVFLPQLEGDLARFADAAESNMRFFAILAGPFYPILHIVKERETARSAANAFDFEAFKSNQLSSTLSVSSNFEPRRSRGTPLLVLPASNTTIFRPDTIFSLLRKAYKDPKLRTVCIMVCKILHNLVEPGNVGGAVSHNELASSIMNEAQAPTLVPLVDYSSLFGEEFQMPNDQWDSSYLNILDIGAVEEGVLHVVFACASEPFMCSKLADNILNLWSSLPLVQALLPVLRPSFGSFDEIDDSFSHWKQPFVQQALSQIVATSSSSLYRPLLHVCAGYLSSFSPSHAKAACLLIDLCFGALTPWLVKVIAKVDLTMELLEDFLGIIQGACQCFPRARAALTYIVLALTGHMDDILTKYKEVKHRILFLLEMLEPFLDLAIISEDKIISTGDMPYVCVENEESTCAIALKIIRTAVHKSDVLPSLETEWRRGSVAPSVLLSILEPHMQLPPDIDICKSAVSNNPEPVLSNATCHSSVRHLTGASGHNNQDDSDGKIEVSEASMKMDISEDASLFFAPPELKSISLVKVSEGSDKSFSDSNPRNVSIENNHSTDKNFKNQFQDALILDANLSVDYFNTHADYLQLTNLGDCELRASEFRQLAADLHSQKDISPEGHDAAIDSLLLAAECYVNPFFMMSYKAGKKLMDQANIKGIGAPQIYEISKLRRISNKNGSELEKITQLELKRDKVVLQILLEAAELDWNYQNKVSDSDNCLCYPESCDEPVTTVSPFDIKSADSVTLLRQNQTLLGSFLIHRLHKTQQSMHEVLLQSFLFLLQSATKLFCAPESIIDIILGSAEHLNRMVTSYYFQFKGGMQFDPEKVHELRRRWILLQNLVNASTHGDEISGLVSVKKCFLSSNLIPPWAWIQRIPTFSLSPYPVVRFLGWMAVSRNAQGYLTARLLLAADLSQLSYLLSVFSDDLLLLNNVANRKNVDANTEKTREGENAQIHSDKSFGVVYPDLRKFFPNMKEQLEGFGEIILEAVALQLKSLSSSVVPDLLCWFSDLCSSPFLRKYQIYAGNGVRNARAIILYTLDAIVTQHMEAMVPEVPRVVQVLVSLCKSSYCDVSFLDSILRLVKPIILYSLHKILDGERLFDNSFLDFESLCFNGLFQDIMNKNENQDSSAETAYFKAFPIFILASVFPKLSFQRKRQFLQSLVAWTNFASFEPTACFLDYLSAFQRAVESCKTLSVQTLRVHCAIPLQVSHFSDGTSSERLDSSEQHLCFLDDLFHSSCLYDVSSNLERGNLDAENLNQLADHLADEEIVYFCEDLEGLIFKLCPTIELCWKLHPQLAKKLALALGECFFYLRCLLSVSKNESAAKKHDAENLSLPLSVDWEAGLEGLAKLILTLQDNRCWEVASLELDCLLGTPKCFCVNNSLEYICSAIKIFSNCAPKLSWRLQTDKWLLILFGRGIMSFNGSINSLIDLLNAMLCHSEPEQRIIALQHLGRFVAQDGNWEISSTYNNKLVSPALYSPVSESILSRLVSDTWNPVVVLASTDSSLPLRMRALTLLLEYIPFADCRKLKSFLEAVDFVLPCLGRLAQSTYEGPFLEHSLALIASAVLYSPSEDISLIPENVWRNIEALGTKRCEGKLGDMENLCRALCKLRQEGDDAKKGVKEVLTSGCSKEFDPDFQSTRESILQVLANLTSVRSYFDMFSNKIDEEAMELEEAEMELDILQKENVCLEPSADTKQGHSFPQFFDHMEEGSRLKQIKDCICSIERAKIREEIAACRQKKLLARQARREFLEKAALQEAELLQELDRKRTAEVEREIGRQHLLELERAKSRELRYNLEIEKEKQMQRELQRELEQAESGVRLSRREFSSIHGSHSRPRERYRERENGRTGSEGSTRTGTGNLQLENPAPTVILSGSRSFSGHPPSILQSRERSDECGSSYEESMDGSKDFSDMGNVGDPELMSAMDGQPGNYGSSQRHGSRGSKSRQAVERREREGGRREGKWERKQS